MNENDKKRGGKETFITKQRNKHEREMKEETEEEVTVKERRVNEGGKQKMT